MKGYIIIIVMSVSFLKIGRSQNIIIKEALPIFIDNFYASYNHCFSPFNLVLLNLTDTTDCKKYIVVRDYQRTIEIGKFYYIEIIRKDKDMSPIEKLPMRDLCSTIVLKESDLYLYQVIIANPTK